MSVEDWKKRLDITKDILIVLGLIVGGGWSIYRFVYLESIDAQIRLQQKKDELATFRNAQVKISSEVIKNGSEFDIKAVIKIENTGNARMRLLVDKIDPVVLSKLNVLDGIYRSDTKHNVTSKFYGPYGNHISDLSLNRGRAIEFPVLFHVDNLGYYLIEAQLGVDERDVDDDVLHPNKIYWTAREIIAVGLNPVAKSLAVVARPDSGSTADSLINK